jgi:hypothetical protein
LFFDRKEPTVEASFLTKKEARVKGCNGKQD